LKPAQPAKKGERSLTQPQIGWRISLQKSLAHVFIRICSNNMEPSAPFQSIAPSQPIPLFVDYGVFETPSIPAGADIVVTTVNADA